MGQEVNNHPRGKDSSLKIRIDGLPRCSGDLTADADVIYSMLGFNFNKHFVFVSLVSSLTLNFRARTGAQAVPCSGLPAAIFRKQLEEKTSLGIRTGLL